jgi:ribonuclease J
MADKKLQVIPLGGLGEFGMNSMALRYGDDIIVIDAGMMFPDSELMGVDIVTPDFTYLEQNAKYVRGLVLTHGHEDHIGGIPFLLAQLNIPVYGTAFTLALVERRLEEHEMLDQAKLKTVKPGDRLVLGPFSIEFIHVTHSIVSCVMLAITTPLGVVMHTGDFKVDPTPTDNILFDLHTLAEYGKRGVLLLMSDSTNVDRPGYTESERAVGPRLEDLFVRSPRRLVISCFSSSIHRLQTILDLASEYGRKVCFFGRSMMNTSEIAHDLGLLTIPNGVLLRPQDVMQIAPSKLVAIVSGTQGEPMSALSRVAVDNHKHLTVEAGDVVALSARIIPGNEKAIYRMINHMARRGCGVRIDESAHPRFRPRQRGRAAPDSEPGAAEVFRAGAWRVSPALTPRETGVALDAPGPEGNISVGIRRHAGDRFGGRAQGSAGAGGARVHRLRHHRRSGGRPGHSRPAPSIGGRLRAADHRHQQAHRQERGAARDREPRLRVAGG